MGSPTSFILTLNGRTRHCLHIVVKLHPNAVTEKLQSELEVGWIIGPYPDAPFENFKCSPLSLQEKYTPGQYRLLHNLSYTYYDKSVNHNIPRQYTVVKYTTLMDVVQMFRRLGPKSIIAKSDIKSSFRIVPLHPHCTNLMKVWYGWEDGHGVH